MASSTGIALTRSKNGTRYCGLSFGSLTGNCRHSWCCKPPAEERGAGNLHATFCGNRRRVTPPVTRWDGKRGVGQQAPSYRAYPRLYFSAGFCILRLVVTRNLVNFDGDSDNG